MQRGLWMLAAVAVLCVAAGARGQDSGRMLQGFIGPVTPDAEPATVESEAPVGSNSAVGGESIDEDLQATSTPAIESTPLGKPGKRPAVSRFGADTAIAGDGTTPSLRAGDGWWRTAGALAISLAVIFAVAAGVRKWANRSGGLLHAMGAGGRAPSGLLYVLGRYPVGRGQTLVLLKLDRRVLLVCQNSGAKGGGMRTLCELNDPEEVASVIMQAGEAEGRTLSDRFREMVSSFDSSHTDAETVLRPVEVPTVRAIESDAADRLHSRLDALRRSGAGVSA